MRHTQQRPAWKRSGANPVFLFATALLFLLLSFSAQAQLTFSPFSRYGMGDIMDPNSGRYFSMAGTSYAFFDPANINRANPASYGDLKLTTLDFNAYGAYRLLRTNLGSTYRFSGGIQNVSFGFSSRKNFGIVFGLAPYSASNYDIIVRDSMMADSMLYYNTNYKADGGLNQFYIGAGVRFFKKLSVGVNGVYAFGSTNHYWQTKFDLGDYSPVNIRRRASLSGIMPQAGVQFGDTVRIKSEINLRKSLTSDKKDLLSDKDEIASQGRDLDRDELKMKAGHGKLEAKKSLIVAAQDKIDSRVQEMMKNERENEKEISRMQEARFRLDKQRKRIEQKIKQDERALRGERAQLQTQTESIDRQVKQIDFKLNEISKGERDSISKKVHKLVSRVGLIYHPGVSLNGTRITQFDNTSVFDTAGTPNTGKIIVPTKFGAGFSVGVATRWQAGADVTLQSWKDFSWFNDSITLQNSMRISIGGEYIPRFYSAKFGERLAWRFGAYFEKTNLIVNGKPVNDMGVTFGVGIPVGRYPLPGAASRINLGIGIGTRGSVSNNLLQEAYLNMRLGINLNDIWFLRPKID